MKKACKNCNEVFEVHHASVMYCNFCREQRRRKLYARQRIHAALEEYYNCKIENKRFLEKASKFLKLFRKKNKED